MWCSECLKEKLGMSSYRSRLTEPKWEILVKLLRERFLPKWGIGSTPETLLRELPGELS